MSVTTQPIDNKALLSRRIRSQESEYDPSVRMLLRPFHSPGYHTTLTAETNPFVHPTHQSLLYALGLLNTEAPEYLERACGILERLLELQDRDPARDTYGIWPWFHEEPLDRMAPPDWNWADFCGKELVLADLLHGHRFPDELREKLRQGVVCACEAIVKRNVGPHYTNIAIMGAFVTLIAGELYGRLDFRDYGLERLEKLKRYTESLGTFQEFNSPNYAVIAIVELSKIHTYSVNPRAKEIADGLLDMAWRMVAEHYHPATRQWAGPHSRNYSTLLTGKIKSFLQMATDRQVVFFSEEELEYDAEWYGSGSRCPDRYLELFARTDSRVLEQRYYRNEDTGFEKRAETHLKPRYALGFFREEIMWNQTRGLVAYFENGGQTTYLQMRCLHDGYDYSSAVLSVAASEDRLLLGVRFLTNGGDTHPALDRIQGKIEAGDFRIRMEFGGCLERVSADTNGKNAEIVVDGLPMRFDSLYAAFGESSAGNGRRDWKWEAVRQEGVLGLDLILHEGPKAIIDFEALDKAALLISLAIGEESSENALPIEVAEENGRVTARWHGESSSGIQQELSIPLKPNDKHPN